MSIFNPLLILPALVLRIFDSTLFFFQRNNPVCPHCHKEIKKSHIQCPICGKIISGVKPSAYGLFTFECDCGEPLRTMRFFGRNQYMAYCPQCGKQLGTNFGEGKTLAFPIVGGAAAGKTTFLMSSLHVLEKVIPQKRGWSADYPLTNDKRSAHNLRNLFKQGITPNKTNQQVPSAFTIEYRTGSLTQNNRVMIYDPSGETFTSDYERLKDQKYYNFMEGVIVIIDPFTLQPVKRLYQQKIQELDSDEQQFISPADPQECVERFLININAPDEDASSHEPRDFSAVPCAVVLTKTDVFDLERYIGDAAVKNYMSKHPSASYREAMDIVCRYWLQKWNGHNILQALDSNFGEVRCFSVSALGPRTQATLEPFKPQRMDEPFEWLLEKTSITRQMNKYGLSIFLSIMLLISGSLCYVLYNSIEHDGVWRSRSTTASYDRTKSNANLKSFETSASSSSSYKNSDSKASISEQNISDDLVKYGDFEKNSEQGKTPSINTIKHDLREGVKIFCGETFEKYGKKYNFNRPRIQFDTERIVALYPHKGLEAVEDGAALQFIVALHKFCDAIVQDTELQNDPKVRETINKDFLIMEQLEEDAFMNVLDREDWQFNAEISERFEQLSLTLNYATLQELRDTLTTTVSQQEIADKMEQISKLVGSVKELPSSLIMSTSLVRLTNTLARTKEPIEFLANWFKFRREFISWRNSLSSDVEAPLIEEAIQNANKAYALAQSLVVDVEEAILNESTPEISNSSNVRL